VIGPRLLCRFQVSKELSPRLRISLESRMPKPDRPNVLFTQAAVSLVTAKLP
jgi:hypothetical protein